MCYTSRVYVISRVARLWLAAYDVISTPLTTTAQRDRDRQRRNSVDYIEVALTDIDSAS